MSWVIRSTMVRISCGQRVIVEEGLLDLDTPTIVGVEDILVARFSLAGLDSGMSNFPLHLLSPQDYEMACMHPTNPPNFPISPQMATQETSIDGHACR